ncbi:MAG: NUDIX domain-containing protein [bacterium]
MEILTEIKDANYPEDMSGIFMREAARIIAIDADQNIALIYVGSEDYYKLPGGGIEKGEDVKEALKRELREETGSEVQVTDEVGQISEYRSKRSMAQTSYCYLGEVTSKGVTFFTETEKARKSELVWLGLEEAVKRFESSKPQSYESGFIIQRDLAFLKKAKEIISQKFSR